MISTRQALVSSIVSVALAITVPAHAEEADSTRRAAVEYDAGIRAFQNGDFEQAARAFERADAAAAHPRARYNAALSWDRARDLPRAADAYAAAIEGKGLDRARTEAADRRLQELRRELGAIDVRRPSGGKVSVAHVAGASIPTRIHVTPGTQHVELTAADGTKQEREIEVHAGERVVLEIAVTSVPLAPTPPARAPDRTPAPQTPAHDQRPQASNARTTWGFVALGGAVAFGAGAVFFGVRTADAIDTYDASGDRDAEARSRAVRYRALTWGAGGASLACTGVGIVLLTGNRSEHGVARAPRAELALGRRGLLARVRF